MARPDLLDIDEIPVEYHYLFTDETIHELFG